MNTSPASDRDLQGITGCMSDYNPEALSVQLAQDIMRAYIQPVCGMEKLTIRQALGRVLATDIISPINVPSHDNSAMDGYALRGEDLAGGQELYLEIIGTALAGAAFMGAVTHKQCVRIMTGAVMPAGCDTVVPQEFTNKTSDTQVKLSADNLRAGDNRRLKGEDLAIGKVAENADAIITSGGVSVGDADHTRQMMHRLGDVAFWSIAMRPGRPLAFGKITSAGKSAYLFGLPGNPVAV
ncbi:MAG: hypothetical protein HYR68_02110, partial [Burkholderiales bacterium]|nr:hypothetical protein [Burkholderiales bacterium]